MSVEAIGAVSLSNSVQAPTQATPVMGGFDKWFAGELNSVNTALRVAESDTRALALGEAPNLHEVMMHLEEAKLSFELLAQVRNRLLEGYQEIMRMQV